MRFVFFIPHMVESGGGNGSPLQYSCLENSMDREAWRASVHGVAESNMTNTYMVESSYIHFSTISGESSLSFQSL